MKKLVQELKKKKSKEGTDDIIKRRLRRKHKQNQEEILKNQKFCAFHPLQRLMRKCNSLKSPVLSSWDPNHIILTKSDNLYVLLYYSAFCITPLSQLKAQVTEDIGYVWLLAFAVVAFRAFGLKCATLILVFCG